jgi:hypothetical protein
MLRRCTSVLTIVLELCLVCVSFAHAQDRRPGQQGPVKAIQPGIPPDFMADLVITSAKATATCTPKGTVNVTIVATVKNESPKGAADLSKATWQIALAVVRFGSTQSGDGSDMEKPPNSVVKPQVGGPKMLQPGESWTGSLDMVGIGKFKQGPSKAGQYGFAVLADPQNAVAESDEKNNEMMAYAFDPCFKS